MNVGDKVYLVSLEPYSTGIQAGRIERLSDVCDCCADVTYYYGTMPITVSRKLVDVATSPESARAMLRDAIQEAKKLCLAEIVRLDTINVDALEIQDP